MQVVDNELAQAFRCWLTTQYFPCDIRQEFRESLGYIYHLIANFSPLNKIIHYVFLLIPFYFVKILQKLKQNGYLSVYQFYVENIIYFYFLVKRQFSISYQFFYLINLIILDRFVVFHLSRVSNNCMPRN